MQNSDYIVVFVTASSQSEAESLRKKLIENKLAACVNTSRVNSIFSWKGNVENQDEVLLIIKTRQALYGKLETLILENHSYEVPEIIAMPIIAGSKPYLDWIDESTKT